MRPSLWVLMFVAVVMLSNPGVDVLQSHTPTVVLVMGSLALVVSWLATVRPNALARATARRLRPSAR